MYKTVFVTASDHLMAWGALNLVGSVKANSNIFDQILVYDLGMTSRQLQRFADIDGVTVKKVAAFVPHWNICWSWKPWVWTDVPSEFVLYLDAGCVVRQSLAPTLEAIHKDGYFVVSQHEALPGGHTLADIIPEDYFKELAFDRSLTSRPVVAGGLVGFRRESPFYSKVIMPTLELVKTGFNLGWSQNEMWRNREPHFMPDPPMRDCRYFRHDQTLFNILLYKYTPDPVISAYSTYGSMEKTDNRQIVWNPKRLSPLNYVARLPYQHGATGRNLMNSLGSWLHKLATLYHIRVLKQRLKDPLGS